MPCTPCTCSFPCRVRRYFLARPQSTPCNSFSHDCDCISPSRHNPRKIASRVRARKLHFLHSPCTYCAGEDAGKSCYPHTACSGSFGARARIDQCHHTPYIDSAVDCVGNGISCYYRFCWMPSGLLLTVLRQLSLLPCLPLRQQRQDKSRQINVGLAGRAIDASNPGPTTRTSPTTITTRSGTQTFPEQLNSPSFELLPPDLRPLTDDKLPLSKVWSSYR